MKQNSSEEGKWEANHLNCKMESTLNNTLQLKYEKQLNVKTSKETIRKKNPINQFLKILVMKINVYLGRSFMKA
jgi:hypothetical protein